ncbi:MAG: chemotaxis protein CheW [Trueperaceae bacterium]|nr:chemotaxis protein CheW [Trueperaceae bacterium]
MSTARAAAARACIVRVGDTQIALEGRYVKEVLEINALTPLPRTDAAILGLTPSRGRVLLLVDLGVLVGKEPLGTPELAVGVEVDGQRFAVAVAAVERFAPLSVAGLEPSPVPFARGQRTDHNTDPGEVTVVLDLTDLAAAVAARCVVR